MAQSKTPIVTPAAKQERRPKREVPVKEKAAEAPKVEGKTVEIRKGKSVVIPDGPSVPVMCKHLKGNFFFRDGEKSFKIVVTSQDKKNREGPPLFGKELPPTVFEKSAGCTQRNWRNSVKVGRTGVSVKDFLKAFNEMTGEKKVDANEN
jgi:hypothetical protein